MGIVDRAVVRQWLREDEKLLMRLLGIILGSLDTLPRIKPGFPGTGFEDIVRNESVREFWRNEFGEQVSFYMPIIRCQY